MNILNLFRWVATEPPDLDTFQTGLTPGIGVMRLGAWAKGFTFMLNTFLEPVAVIARCEGEASGGHDPCKMEYHRYSYDYTENNRFQGCYDYNGRKLDFGTSLNQQVGAAACSTCVLPVVVVVPRVPCRYCLQHPCSAAHT